MLISESYRELNKQLHESNPAFGISGQRYVNEVLTLMQNLKCESVLDYGCGKGTLKAGLGSPDFVQEYDPAIPGKDADPVPADLVVCTDVLEHIEPEMLDSVIADIARLTKKAAYLVIATFPAMKSLPDGRNAHLIQQESPFWDEKLKMHFPCVSALADIKGNLFYVASHVYLRRLYA